MNTTNLSIERDQEVAQWLAQAFQAERAPQRPAPRAAVAALPAAAARGYYWSLLAVSLLTWALA